MKYFLLGSFFLGFSLFSSPAGARTITRLSLKCVQHNYVDDEDGGGGTTDTDPILQVKVSEYDETGNELCSDQYDLELFSIIPPILIWIPLGG